MPLEDVASYDKSTGRFLVEVPIMTPFLGAVVNKEVLSVILPEGATWVQSLSLWNKLPYNLIYLYASDVQYVAPFPAISNSTGNHITYLDTTGRPVLTFQYKDLTVKHAQTILVSI